MLGILVALTGLLTPGGVGPLGGLEAAAREGADEVEQLEASARVRLAC